MFFNFLFYLFSSLMLVCAWLIVSSTNAVHSVLFLVLLFFNASGLLLLIGAEFVAIIFIVVYVGAIAVLFLFVIMMLNIKFNVYLDQFIKIYYIKFLSLLVSLFVFVQFLLIINVDFVSNLDSLTFLKKYINFQHIENYFTYFNWLEYQNFTFNIYSIGLNLYTFFGYLVLLSSVILLIAMIGSITLTLNQRVNLKKQDIVLQIYRKASNVITFVKIK
uniref:NADH dehydrogenase subunit 6 n=1 Tax=Dixoniella grisea TaxID=35153 RepID=UPI001FCCF611|nr:NADH dehydrogenase subunit 6 [Dixoniella grisea]UNJ18992.1 NADH dehydrogenase subunit 6 [Dixoniella grisea]